jgi:hypothetical protein
MVRQRGGDEDAEKHNVARRPPQDGSLPLRAPRQATQPDPRESRQLTFRPPVGTQRVEVVATSHRISEETAFFSFINEWDKFEINCRVLDAHKKELKTILWHFPVETVSLSEGGFELTYQGSSFTWVFPLNLQKDESLVFTIIITCVAQE